MAEPRTAEDYADGLFEGRWVPRKGVQVWVSMRRRRVAKCGTDGGYYRHVRVTKTKACAACKEAHARAEYERNERARKAIA